LASAGARAFTSLRDMSLRRSHLTAALTSPKQPDGRFHNTSSARKSLTLV
jgi:hypothetical protein